MKNFGLILLSIFIALVVFYLSFLKPVKYETSDMFDDIIQRGYIKVGIKTDAKPYGFYDKNGKVIGYDADIARYISQYIFSNRDKVVFVPVTPGNRLIKLTTGEVDIVIATMTITPQRQSVIDFSIPYDSAGMALLVKSSSKITSLVDLSGQNVGVIWGTTAEKSIQNLMPNANIIGFRSYDDAYRALKDGKVNAVTSDDTILSQYAHDDSTVTLLPKRYTREPYGIGLREGKGSAKLKNVLDFAINDMKQKNIINRLHKQWLD